ncbi:MAG: acyltransferase [Clostridia bacterium]|nr:acyltransferase [Clostridia bacterium]
MGKCGRNVSIGIGARGDWGNIHISDNVAIGARCNFMTSKAKIIIGSHTIFGPAVTIVTGNHRIDVVGEYISNITNEQKLPENDADVIFEGDNWIGANSMILKGITVGFGAVVGGGSIVTHDVPAYAIVAGNPARVIKYRFTEEEIKQHEERLKKTKA